MKPINEREFEVIKVPEVSEFQDMKAGVKQALVTLKGFLQVRDTKERLPVRLRRDAGMDELDVECTRIAKAPLIR